MNTQPSLQQVQDDVDVFLTTQSGSQERTFGIFDAGGATRVAELVASFIEKAGREGGSAGLDQVVKAAQSAAAADSIELAQYALMTFIINHDEGRRLILPPFWQRHPYLLDSDPNRQPDSADEDPTERDLNWFREDIFLGEHHEHWHLVYPDKVAEGQFKDRQGELFLYMHQQMLARYNTERIAQGLSTVAAFPAEKFNEAIPEGYDPKLARFGVRKPGAHLSARYGVTPESLTKWSNELRSAIVNGRFIDPQGNAGINGDDLLGHTILGNTKSANTNEYGTLHGTVHSKLAYISDLPGVMGTPSVSIRDPIFFRWHRFIDDLAIENQNCQLPNDIHANAPAVLIRSNNDGTAISQPSDIILSFQSQLDKVRCKDETFDQLGERLFGGGNWDQDFSNKSEVTMDELCTGMNSVPVKLNGEDKSVTFLEPKQEFTYFIRVQNLSLEKRQVTVRIWLVAKYDRDGQPLSNDRRMWIEMDTFQLTLPEGARKVICRPANLSSVIKKSGGKALKPEVALMARGQDGSRDQTDINTEDYCDCGWPYNLLLPKGTANGMGFRLLVMITADDVNLPEDKPTCSSVRLCGARNMAYPDKQRMGYPFNRPFPVGTTIEQTILEQPTMAARDIRIKFSR
jgi:tyrosinase